MSTTATSSDVGTAPAEGRITDNGELSPFRSGIRRILDRTPVPVIPLALKGLWGSFFSRRGGAAMTKPFRRGIFSRVGLEAGPAMAPTAVTPDRIRGSARAAIEEAGTRAAAYAPIRVGNALWGALKVGADCTPD